MKIGHGLRAGFFNLTIGLVAALLCVPAFAAKKSAPGVDYQLEEPPAFTTSYTDKEWTENVAKAKEYANRKIASTDFADESTVLSEQYRNIRNSLIGGPLYQGGKAIKTAPEAKASEDITNLLTELEKNFNAGAYTEPDAQMLAAQLLMLKPFRGLIHRGRNIFEAQGTARGAHAMAVTALRVAAGGIEVYLPTPQWKAGFAYAVEPINAAQPATCTKPGGWGAQCDITNDATFQLWTRSEVLPQLLILNNTLAKLNFTKPVYWDNQILNGKANFTSSKDRLIRLGEAERLLMLSGVQAAISSLYGINAFHFDGFFKSFDSIGAVYGFQVMFDAGRATAEGRFAAIRKYPDLFRYKKETPAESAHYMAMSYSALKQSINNAYLAYTALNGHESDTNLQQNLIDPRLIAPFSRILNTGFSNAFVISGIAGGDVMSAVVNGEKVTVDLKAFYTNPPDSLQDFMPVPGGFEGGPDWNTKVVNGKPVKYRNYLKGRPIAWNYGVYGRYFPGVGGRDDVERTARVLSQSWGGFLLGIPLSMVMF
jgi:hypothetical protein